jgi:hypothetical protein
MLMGMASQRSLGRTVLSLVLSWLFAMAIVGCATDGELTGRPARADPEGQIGAIHLVEDLRAATGVKTIVAAYGFTANGVTPSVARVVYGAGTSPRNEGGDFRLMLVDAGGETLSHYTIRNPRRLLVERKGLIEEDEVFYVAVFPFSARAAQVRVLDRRGKTLAVTEVGSMVRDFCVLASNDEDCADVLP